MIPYVVILTSPSFPNSFCSASGPLPSALCITIFHILHFCSLLGSAILPPSQVPGWDPMFPYIAVPFLLFVSKQFLFHIQTCHLGNLSLVFTSFTSIHLLEIHLSYFLLIILSVCLDFTQTSLRLVFHPYLLCSAIVVFKISFLYSYPQNLHCFFLSFCYFDLSLSPLCLL